MTSAETVLRDLRADEVGDAVAVLSRGMRDNPMHVRAYGDDPERRRRCHARLMRGVLTVLPRQDLVCAAHGDQVVAVGRTAPPGSCRPTVEQRLRLLQTIAGMGPGPSVRVLAWTSAWARVDPSWPHVHVGPIAVDAGFQGRGIGSAVMAELCRRVDELRAASYLETDKPMNVTFYQRFGFEVMDRARVLGMPSWYMARAAT